MNNFLRSVIAFFRMLFTGKFPQKSHVSYKSDFEEVKRRISADQQKRNYTAVRTKPYSVSTDPAIPGHDVGFFVHSDGTNEVVKLDRLSSSPNTIREHRLISQYSKRALSETPAKHYEEKHGLFDSGLDFEVGDVVEWGSQSKGTFAYKQGVIIAVVPEGVEKWDVLKMHGLISEEYGLDRIGKGGKRNHPSFLVEVEGVTGQKKIYHPRVADLSFPK